MVSSIGSPWYGFAKVEQQMLGMLVLFEWMTFDCVPVFPKLLKSNNISRSIKITS